MLINVIDKISYVIYLLYNNVLLECRHLQGLLVVGISSNSNGLTILDNVGFAGNHFVLSNNIILLYKKQIVILLYWLRAHSQTMWTIF